MVFDNRGKGDAVLKKYALIYCSCIACVLIGFACCNFDQDKNYGQNETSSAHKKSLLRLVQDNGIKNDIPKIQQYIDIGEIEYFEAIDTKDNSFFTIFLTYPVRGKGDRSFSFTCCKDRKLMIWSKDSVVSFNGGLFDCNGDGYIEKFVKFLNNEDNSKARYFPDRIQIYSLKHKNAELLLDIEYNLISSPGDQNYLTLYVTPGYSERPSIISLRNFSKNSDQIKFIYSHSKYVYHAIGKRTNNWRMIYPYSE